MGKDKAVGHYIRCANCGGSWGTLVKKGDKYRHARAEDCERYRAVVERKARREEALKHTKKGGK
jgi:hypothetical protein